ncbi:unnamed protein product [Paramecium sonneborni]|uniref:Uncharacterized protein n=1 Tax=Paramecium sonneborni TaxID=65129 RepID=A0A8S1MNW9_9CILI|nr:unnamed protein product [Paramecium sonneborni]
MKTQILLIAMISVSFQALTATNECVCEDFAVTDCKTEYGCVWTESDSSCAAKKVDCTTLTTQKTCDDESTCAWTDSTSKCATFTKCEDYVVSVADQCMEKSGTCVAGTTTDGKTTCKTQAATTVTCTSFSSAADCNYKRPSNTATCWFKGSACESIDTSKCSTITVQDLCAGDCKWETDKCAVKTCADFKTADDCDTVSLDDGSGVTICTWGTACAEAADVSALTKDNCLKKTSGYYYWDGSACSECEGSSNSYILAFIGFIVMLMF